MSERTSPPVGGDPADELGDEALERASGGLGNDCTCPAKCNLHPIIFPQ